MMRRDIGCVAANSKAAVIDLGSNSLKMVNYNIGWNNDYKPYHQESIRTRLSEGLEDGTIGAKYADKTIEALKLFRNIVDFEQIGHVVCVATSAVRDAKNGGDLLDRISRHTGFSFRILSEKEEAVYSYTGAVRSLSIPTAVFFDIGGGSLEVVHAAGYELRKVASLPLGSLRLRQAFCGSDGTLSYADYERMRKHVVSALPSRQDLGISGAADIPIIGVGGSLRAMARYDQQREDYPLSKMHNYRLSANSIFAITDELSSMSDEVIAGIRAIGSGRADTIRPGACVISEIVRKMGSSEVIVSAHGLREGTLAVSLQSPHAFDRSSATDAQLIYDVICLASSPDTLSEYVEDLVRLLFSMGLISEHERVLLAQSIQQINMLSSFRDADNLMYSILDNDSSLSHREQVIIAISLIYSKKKKKAEEIIARYGSILSLPADRGLIKKISSIVSLCDILHKTGTQARPTTDQRGGVLHLSVSPSKSTFPEILFEQACKKLSETLGITVRQSVSYRQRTGSGPMKVTRDT